jgi:hypothetical protein
MIKMKKDFTIDELREMVGEVNSWNGGLDYLDYQENDEEFFNTYFYNKPDEAVRATYYGDYNYMDDYVRFNAYGNLESCSKLEFEKELENYQEEIIDAYYENINEMTDNELKNKVKKYMEEQK